MGDVEVTIDREKAIFYGDLIQNAYNIYGNDPENAVPTITGLPDNVEFICYVQMKDFVLLSEKYRFYGYLLRYREEPDRHILVIRGTHGDVEWWDDFTSMVLVPWKGAGKVGYGFDRLYRTLRLILPSGDPPSPVGSDDVEEPEDTFTEQVAEAATGALTSNGGAPIVATTIEVVGHSLGSALATLYVARNADLPRSGTARGGVVTPVVYVFASPRVGDSTFAAAFDALPLECRRVVNELDVVPRLPPAILGFQHVDGLFERSSGEATIASLGCLHAIPTYLHMIDDRIPVSAKCARPSS